MIGHEVDDQLYTGVRQLLLEFVELSHRTEVLIGREVVPGMIAVVACPSVMGRLVAVGIGRGDPDRGYAHALKIGYLVDYALPVAALIESDVGTGAVKQVRVKACWNVVCRVAVVETVSYYLIDYILRCDRSEVVVGNSALCNR